MQFPAKRKDVSQAVPSIAGTAMLTLSDPPSKVLQDDFSPGKGNALQACVASMFSQSLSDVPNFVALQCGYEEGIRQYLQSNSGPGKTYSYVKKKPEDVVQSDSNRLCILRGKSPRGDFGHVVVARVLLEASTVPNQVTFEMVHDPHPDGTFLDDSEAYGWCMFFHEA